MEFIVKLFKRSKQLSKFYNTVDNFVETSSLHKCVVIFSS